MSTKRLSENRKKLLSNWSLLWKTAWRKWGMPGKWRSSLNNSKRNRDLQAERLAEANRGRKYKDSKELSPSCSQTAKSAPEEAKAREIPTTNFNLSSTRQKPEFLHSSKNFMKNQGRMPGSWPCWGWKWLKSRLLWMDFGRDAEWFCLYQTGKLNYKFIAERRV